MRDNAGSVNRRLVRSAADSAGVGFSTRVGDPSSTVVRATVEIMQCPVCGGNSARSDGRDRFVCTSRVRLRDELVGVVPANPYQPFQVPVYQPVYRPCGHRFTSQDASRADERRLARVREEERARQAEAEVTRLREAEAATRRDWEDARDAEILWKLPSIPVPRHPGNAPYAAEQLIFVILGFVPYWIGGTLLLWFLPFAGEEGPTQSGLILSAIVAGAACALVVGVHFLREARERRTHAVALRAHETAVQAERAREAERDRLRASSPYRG
jgi:hypothetical protein